MAHTYQRVWRDVMEHGIQVAAVYDMQADQEKAVYAFLVDCEQEASGEELEEMHHREVHLQERTQQRRHLPDVEQESGGIEEVHLWEVHCEETWKQRRLWKMHQRAFSAVDVDGGKLLSCCGL